MFFFEEVNNRVVIYLVICWMIHILIVLRVLKEIIIRTENSPIGWHFAGLIYGFSNLVE